MISLKKAWEWIQGHWFGLIVAYAFIFILTYIAMWQIAEPLNILDDARLNQLSDRMKQRVFFYPILTLLISAHITLVLELIFRWRSWPSYSITPQTYDRSSPEGPMVDADTGLIHRIDFNYKDSPTKHGWQIGDESQFVFKPYSDGHVGSALEIKSLSWEAMDYHVSDVNPAAELGTGIEYVTQLGKRAVIYTLVSIQSQDRAESRDVWLNFQVGRRPPEPLGEDRSEWSVYVQPVHREGPWLVFQVDLNDAVKRTYGKEGWKFVGLKRFRLRGSLSLAHISVFES